MKNKIIIERVAFQQIYPSQDGLYKVIAHATIDGKRRHLDFRVPANDAQEMLARLQDKWIIEQFKKGIKNEQV